MDLKDLFAAHVAAALASRVERPDVIASRAYDLAEALLRERARRSPDADDELVAADPAEDLDDGMPDESFFQTQGLLDEPAPFSDREGMELPPSWLERDDPKWEVEPKWSAPVSERPGLRRTTPIQAEEEKKRRPA
ncbi:MAG: hypothetical protein HOW73_35815 [Polyangiaceae bacterium]|nr:hypothetical protein [Polyangiaceae bacterium]